MPKVEDTGQRHSTESGFGDSCAERRGALTWEVRSWRCRSHQALCLAKPDYLSWPQAAAQARGDIPHMLQPHVSHAVVSSLSLVHCPKFCVGGWSPLGHIIKREWRERASSTARNLPGSGQASFGGKASSAFQHSAKATHVWRTSFSWIGTRLSEAPAPGCPGPFFHPLPQGRNKAWPEQMKSRKDSLASGG